MGTQSKHELKPVNAMQANDEQRMLHDAAVALEQGIEPPALDASEQRVRPAGVLLPKGDDPLLWAKTHLANGLDEPVFSI